jgi:hypothetical protein
MSISEKVHEHLKNKNDHILDADIRNAAINPNENELEKLNLVRFGDLTDFYTYSSHCSVKSKAYKRVTQGAISQVQKLTSKNFLFIFRH